jgi:L-asparagine transporter-like permease
MSASFPEMAFWVIFPLAALIVLSGWVMILISAVKKLHAGKRKEENKSTDVPSLDEPVLHQPSWTAVDGIVSNGDPYIPPN